MVKILLSNAGSAGLTLGQGTKIPHALGPKKPKQNRSSIITNSVDF